MSCYIFLGLLSILGRALRVLRCWFCLFFTVRPPRDCAYSEHLYLRLPTRPNETRRLSPGSSIPFYLQPFALDPNCHFIREEQINSIFVCCVCLCVYKVLLVMTAWVTDHKNNICSSHIIHSNARCVIIVCIEEGTFLWGEMCILIGWWPTLQTECLISHAVRAACIKIELPEFICE